MDAFDKLIDRTWRWNDSIEEQLSAAASLATREKQSLGDALVKLERLQYQLKSQEQELRGQLLRTAFLDFALLLVAGVSVLPLALSIWARNWAAATVAGSVSYRLLEISPVALAGGALAGILFLCGVIFFTALFLRLSRERKRRQFQEEAVQRFTELVNERQTVDQS